MRDKLAVLLMEEETGGVAVQLFADPDAAKASFDELKGKVHEPKRRATLTSLKWSADGVKVEAVSRDLPVPIAEAPDGYVLGEGPRKPEVKP